MLGIAEFTPEFFDNASAIWRSNKTPIGEGSFRYKKNAFPPIKPRVRSVRSAEKKRPLKNLLRRSPRLAAKKRITK